MWHHISWMSVQFFVCFVYVFLQVRATFSVVMLVNLVKSLCGLELENEILHSSTCMDELPILKKIDLIGTKHLQKADWKKKMTLARDRVYSKWK